MEKDDKFTGGEDRTARRDQTGQLEQRCEVQEKVEAKGIQVCE